MNHDDKKKPKNSPCSLLTAEENFNLFDSLGFKCFTLSSAVVQVFLTDQPNHENWVKKFCGVACFIKDFMRKSYFIRVFDMDKCAFIWEQEVYNQFVYKAPCAFFHTFEADNCMAGFNFADNKEAFEFETAIQKKLQARQDRRQEKKRNQQATHPTNTGVIVARAKSESMPSLVTKEEKSRKENKRKRKKITKEDISEPTNFIHKQHVGWNPETGFDLENVDSNLADFFTMAGVTEADLENWDTRKFIYEFIVDNGGVERAVLESNLTRSPPPPPAREAPPTPRNHRGPARAAAPPPPPPPPAIPPVSSKQPVTPQSRTCIPPPPPTRVPPPPRPPPVSDATRGTSVMPPPPPLPPMSCIPNSCVPPPPPPCGIPPPPPMPPSGNDCGDSKSALFDQIRKGKVLHHVESNESVESNNNSDDARGALLNQIRRGVELKPVADEPRSLTADTPMQGLAGALARALLERNRAIHQTDESDSGDEDDDEWED